MCQLTAGGSSLLLQSHWLIEGVPFRLCESALACGVRGGRGRRSHHDEHSSPSRNGHTRSQIGPAGFTAARLWTDSVPLAADDVPLVRGAEGQVLQSRILESPGAVNSLPVTACYSRGLTG